MWLKQKNLCLRITCNADIIVNCRASFVKRLIAAVSPPPSLSSSVSNWNNSAWDAVERIQQPPQKYAYYDIRSTESMELSIWHHDLEKMNSLSKEKKKKRTWWPVKIKTFHWPNPLSLPFLNLSGRKTEISVMGWSAGWASFTRIDGMGIYKQGKAVVF